MIEHFFESPTRNLGTVGHFSVLYLLRRDIYICFGFHPDDYRRLDNYALWPASMAVLAGIDLLGKFYAGNANVGGVGDRFRNYLKDNFIGLSSTEEEVIYQLRNSLLHSFGLYSKAGATEYKFTLRSQDGPFIQSDGANGYTIDIVTLWKKFEESIGNYYRKIKSTPDLESKFHLIWPNYGSVHIGAIDATGHQTSGFNP